MKRIYFIWDGDNHIKIGISSAVTGRLAALQTGSPRRLGLLFTIDGTDDEERLLHQCFRRWRREGEWFEVNHTLHSFMSYIQEHTNANDHSTITLDEAMDGWYELLLTEARLEPLVYDQHAWADAVQAG